MSRKLYPLIAILTALQLTAAADPAAKTVPQTVPAAEADDTDEKNSKPPASTKPSPAEEKYWQAVRLSDSKDPAEKTKARAFLQAAADLEFPHAQTYLAECLMAGEMGFSKDQRKAANLYRLAAERGNAWAQVSLGQCYYFGNGVRKNREKAAEWLELAASEKADYTRPTPSEEFLAATAKERTEESKVAGELDRDSEGDCRAAAHYLLGLLAAEAKKTDQAQKHFVAAATAGLDGRSGIYNAAVQAALNYAFGQGTPRDMTKANDMLATSRKLTVRSGMRRIHHYSTSKAAIDFDTAELEDKLETEGEKFQTELQFDIAKTFTDKKSKDYNPAEAVKWFELAADSGSTWAMIRLAFLFAGNELGKPDLEKSYSWFEKAGGGDKPKHYLATGNLAICLNNGIGTAKDTAKATELFNKHKDQDFVCYLGTLNQCPAKIVTWEERLKLIETWAKDKKDPHAQFMLGERYRDAWDGKADIKAAIKWFKKASDSNHGAAWYALGLLHDAVPGAFDETYFEGRKNAQECIKNGSDANYPPAMADYAFILSKKLKSGYSPEIEKLYIRCLELDQTNAQAHNNLGVIFENKSRDHTNGNVVKDKELMFTHYEAAVQLGYALAARNLAKVHEDGFLVPTDRRKAYSYYEKAAELGMTEMHYDIGQMLEKGVGVSISYTEAAYHYRLAALENHVPSLRSLINLYLSGKTGEVEFDRALSWLFKLARHDPDALMVAIDVLLQKKEFASAVELLRILEKDGNAAQVSFACERLSRCYELGEGVKANPAKAKKYYARALEGNDPEAVSWHGMQLMKEGKHTEAIAAFKQASSHSSNACFYLGQLYFFGTHVEKDQTRALQLMRRAASANNAEALYFLAGATYNNISGAPTLEEAIRMVTQAEVSGHAKAKGLREKLEKRRDKKSETAPEEAARARSS